MSTKLNEARDLLAKRLEEIDREREQLVAAIKQLDGLTSADNHSAGTSRRNSRGSTARNSSGSARRKLRATSGKRSSNGRRKRAPRGKREQQLLASIKTNPGYRVSEHAREVGVSPQQLYPILGRLVAKDAIVKKDSKYALKS